MNLTSEELLEPAGDLANQVSEYVGGTANLVSLAMLLFGILLLVIEVKRDFRLGFNRQVRCSRCQKKVRKRARVCPYCNARFNHPFYVQFFFLAGFIWIVSKIVNNWPVGG